MDGQKLQILSGHSKVKHLPNVAWFFLDSYTYCICVTSYKKEAGWDCERKEKRKKTEQMLGNKVISAPNGLWYVKPFKLCLTPCWDVIDLI
jgi:hypothetical protein